MLAPKTVFNFLSRRNPPLDRDLFEEAYSASDAFRQKIPRKDFERAERALFPILEKFPLLRILLTRDPKEDDNVISNRQALILLWVRADGRFRKYDKKIPAYLHSLEVTEIFLGIARSMSKHGAPITPRERVRAGVRKGFLHDMSEDFKTTITEINELFGLDISRSVRNMSTPDLPDLVADQRLREVTTKYIVLPSDMERPAIEQLLNHLERNQPTTYVNLKGALQLQHKIYARKELSLVECLLRGSDNIHAIFSDIRDLKNGTIYIHPTHDNSPPRSTPLALREGFARDGISTRSEYQTALYHRIDQLKEQQRQGGARSDELRVFDVAKEELKTAFESVATEFRSEMQKALDASPPPTPAASPAAEVAWKSARSLTGPLEIVRSAGRTLARYTQRWSNNATML